MVDVRPKKNDEQMMFDPPSQGKKIQINIGRNKLRCPLL